MLSNRQKGIILHLLDVKEPVLIEDLANKFSVTKRTVKSDIKIVKSWVKSYHVTLESKPNKGVWLEWKSETDQLYFHQNLLMTPVNEDIYSVESRIQRINLILILHPASFITADMLAESLDVSKKTIYSDIKQVKVFVKQHQLSLDTITGKGYILSGKEVDIRYLAEYILAERLADYHTTVEENLSQIRYNLHSLSPQIAEIMHFIHDAMDEFYDDWAGEKLLSNRLVSIIIRLIISVCRNVKGHQLDAPQDDTNLSTDYATFIHSIINKVNTNLHLAGSKNELAYVFQSTAFDQKQHNIIEIANHIIQYVSHQMSIPFYEDDLLQVNLMAHLSNKFTEESLDLFKQNPFLDEIKEKHGYLYEPVKMACKKYIESNPKVSNELISSFIALHFLVSLETNFSQNKPLKALYVCATGRGVARIVKYRVEREIPQIKVVQYCSVDKVDQLVSEHTFDLVISVYPLDIDIPTIWVQPVPTNKNIEEIKTVVERVLGSATPYATQTTSHFPTEKTPSQDAGEISREIILQSMEIYHSLKEALGERIKPGLEEAFLMHVFLMVHRVTFNQAYDYHLTDHIEPSTENYKLVDEIFKNHQLKTSIDEKKAILFYIEEDINE